VKTRTKVRFEPYDDNILYNSLLDSDFNSEDLSFCDLYEQKYQGGKIKLDISVGLSTNFLDILNI